MATSRYVRKEMAQSWLWWPDTWFVFVSHLPYESCHAGIEPLQIRGVRCLQVNLQTTSTTVFLN